MKIFRDYRKNMIKDNKIIKYVFYALGEIVLIVIGILFALYLQNRNEEKKMNETISTSINMIKDELLTNQNKIETVREYHIMIRDTLDKMDVSGTKKGMNGALSFWKGMRTPRLQDAAFQSCIQSGLGKEINPLVLKTLNSLYTSQEGYNDFTSQSAQIFFNTDFTDFDSTIKMMASVKMIMNDLFYYERALKKNYSSTIKELDSIYNTKK